MNYQEVKAKILASDHVSHATFMAAIEAQTVAVAVAVRSLAKHRAKLTAGALHPWPLPADQEGRVMRREALFAVEGSRLERLFFWLEATQAEVSLATRPQNSG